MARSVKVATPATAVTLVVPVRWAPTAPVPPVIVTVTLPLKPELVLPWASRAVTTAPIALPAVVAAGWVVNASVAAGFEGAVELEHPVVMTIAAVTMTAALESQLLFIRALGSGV